MLGYVLTMSFGVACIFNSKDKELEVSLGVGIVTIVTTLIASIINPLMANFAFLKTFVYGLITLVIALILKKFMLKDYCMASLIDSVALGTALNVTLQNADLTSALTTAVFAAISFLIANYVLNALFDKIDDWKIPQAFRGVPIRIITFAIFAMVFRGF